MPVTPTYPGVYVQEIPSGVHTIIGVSTSITAFVGRAARGPVNEPITINNFADFERTFGGLWSDSRLGYAVRDFFTNGGNRAVVVRLFHAAPPVAAPLDITFNAPATTSSTVPAFGAKSVSLPLQAASPGSWGNYVRVRIDNYIAQNAGKAYGLDDADLFNLTVLDMRSGVLEVFRNVSLKPGSQQVDKVLANQSQLVRVRVQSDGSYAAVTPPATPPTPPAQKTDIWHDDTQSTGVDKGKLVTDGDNLTADDFTGPGLDANKQGLYALEKVDLFNLVCIPPLSAATDVPQNLWQDAAAYCEKRRAMLIIDPPAAWTDKTSVVNAMNQSALGVNSRNALLYFPRLIQHNLLNGNQLEQFAPSGAAAGVIARTDAQRGVWKAPAGLEATLNGVTQLSVPLTDDENGESQSVGCELFAHLPGRWSSGLGRSHVTRRRSTGFGMEIHSGATPGALHRRKPLSRHQVGRV